MDAAQHDELERHVQAINILAGLGQDQPQGDPDMENVDAENSDIFLPPSQIEHVKIAQEFIQEIQLATLDNGNLDPEVVERLRNPERGPIDISDPDTRLSEVSRSFCSMR